jgi:dTDP-4-dehydrorhamnose reductase
MRILVTGADGQLGQEWSGYLVKKKIGFEGLGKKSLDITNRKNVRSVLDRLNPEVIINCAAYTDVDGAENNFETAKEVNGYAVGYLADWCYRNGTKLVHFSTDYVFPGMPEDKQHYPGGYTESSRIEPVNRYGESKAAGEKFLINSQADYLLIRVSWLSSRFGNNFVKTIMKLGKQKKELKVVNDQFGSPTFATSAVHYTYLLIESGFSGTYHISSNGLITWYEYAREILLLAEIDASVIPVTSAEFPTIAERPVFSKLDCHKICNELGVEMELWQEGLQTLINNLDSTFL